MVVSIHRRPPKYQQKQQAPGTLVNRRSKEPPKKTIFFPSSNPPYSNKSHKSCGALWFARYVAGIIHKKRTRWKRMVEKRPAILLIRCTSTTATQQALRKSRGSFKENGINGESLTRRQTRRTKRATEKS